MSDKVNDLVKQRAAAYDEFKALAEKDVLTADEQKAYADKKRAVQDLDSRIERAKDAQALAASTAQPVAGQDRPTVPAAVETDRYTKERSLVIGGVM